MVLFNLVDDINATWSNKNLAKLKLLVDPCQFPLLIKNKGGFVFCSGSLFPHSSSCLPSVWPHACHPSSQHAWNRMNKQDRFFSFILFYFLRERHWKSSGHVNCYHNIIIWSKSKWIKCLYCLPFFQPDSVPHHTAAGQFKAIHGNVM